MTARYKNLTCDGCGCAFDSLSRNSKQKYCSQSCAGKNNKNKGRFKSGGTSWNSGLTVSGMSGKTVSKETKEKMRISSCGENATNWKGGVSTENELARKSWEYKEWRALVFERDNYTCVKCGARSRKGARVILHADHIKPFAVFKNLRFDVNNGRTLCVGCHKKTKTWGMSSLYQKDYTGKKAELINGE